ncbi:MAG TPA: hypothetical protein VIK95_10935 [Egibacteraceae bacterium]
MTAALGSPSLLVDTRAGHGAARAEADRLAALLRDRDVDVRRVDADGPAACAAALGGPLADEQRYLVVVGDDASAAAVVNALYDVDVDTRSATPRRPDLVVAVAATAWGCDLVRTYGWDRRADVIAKRLLTDLTMTIDLGLVVYVDPQGRRAARLFANLAQAGWGAELVRRRQRWRRLGRVGNLLAAYGAIRATKRPTATVAVAHTRAELPVTDLVVANGQFFNDGMKVAPRALPDDGRFNVQVFTGERSQLFLDTQRIYRGEHLPDPRVVEHQSPTVAIEAPEPLAVEADGIWLGSTPAVFTVVPKALQLKI